MRLMIGNESRRLKHFAPPAAQSQFSEGEFVMVKRMLMVAALGVAGLCTSASTSEAGVFFGPFAPVRRIAYRAVLPPYPLVGRA